MAKFTTGSKTVKINGVTTPSSDDADDYVATKQYVDNHEGTTYTAGDGIDIDSSNVISSTTTWMGSYDDSTIYNQYDVVIFGDERRQYLWNSSTPSVAGTDPDDSTSWVELNASESQVRYNHLTRNYIGSDTSDNNVTWTVSTAAVPATQYSFYINSYSLADGGTVRFRSQDVNPAMLSLANVITFSDDNGSNYGSYRIQQVINTDSDGFLVRVYGDPTRDSTNNVLLTWQTTAATAITIVVDGSGATDLLTAGDNITITSDNTGITIATTDSSSGLDLDGVVFQADLGGDLSTNYTYDHNAGLTLATDNFGLSHSDSSNLYDIDFNPADVPDNAKRQANMSTAIEIRNGSDIGYYYILLTTLRSNDTRFRIAVAETPISGDDVLASLISGAVDVSNINFYVEARDYVEDVHDSEYIKVNSTGDEATAGGTDGIAIGENADASGEDAVAVGKNSVASGSHASAYGAGATSSHSNSTAVGLDASTERDNEIKLGTSDIVPYLDGDVNFSHDNQVVTRGYVHDAIDSSSSTEVNSTQPNTIADVADVDYTVEADWTDTDGSQYFYEFTGNTDDNLYVALSATTSSKPNSFTWKQITPTTPTNWTAVSSTAFQSGVNLQGFQWDPESAIAVEEFVSSNTTIGFRTHWFNGDAVDLADNYTIPSLGIDVQLRVWDAAAWAAGPTLTNAKNIIATGRGGFAATTVDPSSASSLSSFRSRFINISPTLSHNNFLINHGDVIAWTVLYVFDEAFDFKSNRVGLAVNWDQSNNQRWSGHHMEIQYGLKVEAVGDDNAGDLTLFGDDYSEELTFYDNSAGVIPAARLGSTPSNSTFLRGDNTWQAVTGGTEHVMDGATSSAAGTQGEVPAPAAGQQNRFLRGDATWAVVTTGDTDYVKVNSDGTASSAGGTDAIAIGEEASAAGADGIAIGARSTASGSHSAVLGAGATASDQESVAIGVNAATERGNNIMLGDANALVTVQSSVAGKETLDNQLVSKEYVDNHIAARTNIVNATNPNEIVDVEESTVTPSIQTPSAPGIDITRESPSGGDDPAGFGQHWRIPLTGSNLNGITDIFSEHVITQQPNSLGALRYDGIDGAPISVTNSHQMTISIGALNSSERYRANLQVILHVGELSSPNPSDAQISGGRTIGSTGSVLIDSGGGDSVRTQTVTMTAHGSNNTINAGEYVWLTLREVLESSFPSSWANRTITVSDDTTQSGDTITMTCDASAERAKLIVNTDSSNRGDIIYEDRDGNTRTIIDEDDLLIVPAAMGSGTPSNTTFLRGDGFWADPAGSHEAYVDATPNDNSPTDADAGTGSVAIGDGSQAYNRGVAIGLDAQVSSSDTTNPDAVAVGHSASANATSAVALGDNATAHASTSVVIGHDADDGGASSQGSVVIGDSAALTDDADASVAIGKHSLGGADESISIGGSVSDTNGASASATRSIALGYETSVGATHSNSIALGAGATTTAANELVIGNSTSITAISTPGFTGGSGEYISIDANGDWSTGVPAGGGGGTDDPYVLVTTDGTGTDASVDGTGGVAIGDGAAVGTSSVDANSAIALGLDASATDHGCVVIGREAVASGLESIVIGPSQDTEGRSSASGEQSIVIGNDASTGSLATGSIAIGQAAAVAGSNTIAIGNSINQTVTSTQDSILLGRSAGTSASGRLQLSGFLTSVQSPGFTGGTGEFIAVDANGNWSTETAVSALSTNSITRRLLDYDNYDAFRVTTSCYSPLIVTTSGGSTSAALGYSAAVQDGFLTYVPSSNEFRVGYNNTSFFVTNNIASVSAGHILQVLYRDSLTNDSDVGFFRITSVTNNTGSMTLTFVVEPENLIGTSLPLQATVSHEYEIFYDDMQSGAYSFDGYHGKFVPAVSTTERSTGYYLSGTGAWQEYLADGDVAADALASNSVTAVKIANNAVTAAKIADNSVGASELNVSGNGFSGQVLSSDADGTFTWVNQGSFAQGAFSNANTASIGTAGFATAIGASSEATGSFSAAFGDNADATAIGAIAIGADSDVSTQAGIAIGRDATVSGTSGIAIGSSATTSTDTTASGTSSIAIGDQAVASATNAMAIGVGATNSTANSLVLGSSTSLTAISTPGFTGGTGQYIAVDANGAWSTSVPAISETTGTYTPTTQSYDGFTVSSTNHTAASYSVIGSQVVVTMSLAFTSSDGVSQGDQFQLRGLPSAIAPSWGDGVWRAAGTITVYETGTNATAGGVVLMRGDGVAYCKITNAAGVPGTTPLAVAEWDDQVGVQLTYLM